MTDPMIIFEILMQFCASPNKETPQIAIEAFISDWAVKRAAKSMKKTTSHFQFATSYLIISDY